MAGQFGMTLYEMMWKAQAAGAQQAQAKEKENYDRAVQERSFLLRSQQQAQQTQTLEWEKERAENRFRDKLMQDMDLSTRKLLADQKAAELLEKGRNGREVLQEGGRMDRAFLEDQDRNEDIRLKGDGKAADLDLAYLLEEGRNKRAVADRLAGVGRIDLRQGNTDRQFIQGRIDHWNAHPIQRRMGELTDAYDQIMSASGTGAGDLVAMTKFMKLLDPGSTVRESEMINARKITGFDGTVNSIIRYAEGGGIIDPAIVREIKAQAKDLVAASGEGYKRVRKTYRDQASRLDIDPNMIAPEDEGDPYHSYLMMPGNPQVTKPTQPQPSLNPVDQEILNILRPGQ